MSFDSQKFATVCLADTNLRIYSVASNNVLSLLSTQSVSGGTNLGGLAFIANDAQQRAIVSSENCCALLLTFTTATQFSTLYSLALSQTTLRQVAIAPSGASALIGT